MNSEEDTRLKRTEAELAEADTGLNRLEKEVEAEVDLVKKIKLEVEELEKKREPTVEFTDVNTLDSVCFHSPWSTRLTTTWDKAAMKLEEPRKPDDRLQTPEGLDLTPYLALTLGELEEQKIVPALIFQIVGKTGGA